MLALAVLVLRLKNGVDHFKVEAGGKIFCNYNMALDDDPRLSLIQGWVKEQIEAIPEPEVSGGSFVGEYDGNRLSELATFRLI